MLPNLSISRKYNPVLVSALGGGREGWLRITQKIFNLDKNSLLHRWSQVDEILSIVDNYQVSNANNLEKAMNELKQMTPEVQECPQFQFLEVQPDYLLTPSNKINYTKYLLILAGEFLCISPAAYRMLRNSRAIILPRERSGLHLSAQFFAKNC